MLIICAKGPGSTRWLCRNSGIPEVYARFRKNGAWRGQNGKKFDLSREIDGLLRNKPPAAYPVSAAV
jgi:hypothetical protein